ncbi:MAG: hypothetical protein ACI9KE_001180 [Polyangiales bacterium]|jgi:hypothetical protein
MTIRFSYSPADAILTLGIRDQPDEIIKRALKRAAETAAVEIRVCDASNSNRWPAIAELCARQGPRFVYRRVSNAKNMKSANAA